MIISRLYTYLSRPCLFLVSMYIALFVSEVYSMPLEKGSPNNIAVQQISRLTTKPISVVAPIEITRMLLEGSAKLESMEHFIEQEQVAGAEDLLIDGFEATFPGSWDVFDNDGVTNGEIFWDQVTLRSFAGTKSAWCAGGGVNGIADGSPYANNMQSWMVAGPFDLSDANSGIWQFESWLKTELDLDIFLYLTSIDGSSFNGYQTSGDSGGWVSNSLDFTAVPFDGDITGESKVWVAFVFQSNDSITDEGVYVDEVLVQKGTSDGTADLSLETIDAQNGIFLPGSKTVIHTEITNIGDGVSPAYSANYYISGDQIISSGDRFLGGLGLPPLDAGASEIFNLVEVTLPGDLTNGEYYIGAILDIADANANNNVNHDPVPIMISSDPDIEIRPLSLDFEEPVEAANTTPTQDDAAFDVLQFKRASLSKLTARVTRRGKVDLIVGLKMSTRLEGQLSAVESRLQQQSIRTRGEQLINQLSGMNNQVRRQFQFAPYIALSADLDTLEFLAQSPLVASISEDKISRVNMASSNPVIGSPIAWAEGYDGSGWAVAVLDTGVDNTHSWFTTNGNKVVSEACYSSNVTDVAESLCPQGANSSTAADSALNCDPAISGCDHGTHVAGTVAGNDEGGPNFGVAREADIVAIQVFSKFLTEDDCGAGQAPCISSYDSDLIAALERVLTLADSISIAAVNMSLGGGIYFDQESCDIENAAAKTAIDNLRSVGIATVIATGNDGWANSIAAPGCISTAVSVGATTDFDQIASFSNIYPEIHLLAPGVDIDSSVPGGGVISKQGTSMATPHVAGTWAVMKQLSPEATVAEVLATLQNTGTPVSDLRTGGIETDIPRINLELAIAEQRTTFGIFNHGPATLAVTSMAPETAAAWISWLPEAPFEVLPGEMQLVSIVIDYSLAPAGLSQTRLLVSSNDLDESPYPNGVMINVTKALSTEPEFSSTPAPGSTLAFGDVVIETTSSPMLITVDNLGGAELTLACDITGVNADQFTLVACPSPVTAAGSTEIPVTCNPISIGSKQATLEVSSNDADEGEVGFTLTCTGVEPPDEGAIFSNGFEGDPLPDLHPDLMVIDPDVNISELTANQAYTIDATVRNQGDGPSDVSTLRYFLSFDNVIASDDLPIGLDAIPSLSPDTDSVQSLPTIAPVDGTYWVGACIDTVAGELITDNQCSTAIQIVVGTPLDSDNDRLPDSVETNTGIYVDENNTGTHPGNPDTDNDGIKDGDEVLGTLAGLDLPGLGVNPLRKDLLLEYDWFDDSLECGSHTHRPSAAAIASVTTAFNISPTANPDGTSGVYLISDYGQGGVFTGGNFISDENGVIDSGVGGTEFLTYKANNFDSRRNGYFHYVLLPHRYNTNSGSSGQAEVAGDDMIVSLQCNTSNRNVAHTIMHEVGHNLILLHGGNDNCNYKPNYNSVMNYKYQFPGVDDNCTPPGDNVLNFSIGDRIDLDENNLDENNGTCGPGYSWNWNLNPAIESSVTYDINSADSNQASACGGTLSTLHDANDWDALYFGGIGDADGAMAVPLQIITEQPVPAEYLKRIN